MSTKFLSPGWRMPRNANQSKQSNYSMDFDGSSQYIEIAHNSYFDQSVYSFSFWLKNNINSGASNDGIITADSSTRGWSILQDDQTLKFNPNISGGSGQIDITNFFNTTSTWIHCAITFDGTNLIVYKNGTSVGSSSSGTRNLNSNNNPLRIGNNTFASGRFFNGQINEVCIFDYALSPSQVTTLWGGGTSVSNPMALSSPPVAYYPLGTSAYNGEYLSENNAIGDYVFDFDANSGGDFIDLGSSEVLFNSASGFSFSTWCKLENYSVVEFPAFCRLKTDQATGFIIGLSDFSDYQGVFIGSDSNFLTARTQGDISSDFIGVWKHVVVTFDGVNRATLSSYKIYVDGQPITLTTAGTFGTTLNDNRLGYGNNTGTPFNGLLSNSQIFDTELSATEVTTLYNYGSPIRTLANIPQNSNLKAWYKLDASEVYNSSTTEWSIDNNQNPSAYPSSLNFNGSSNYIDCDTGSRFDIDQITISAWVKLSSGLTSTQVIAGIRNTNSGSICYQLQNQASGKFRFVIFQSNGTYVDSVANDVHQYNTWYNVVGVADGSNIKLYINGDLQTIVNSYDGTIYSPNENFNIGRQSSPSDYYWDGELSNVSVFNTGLSLSQVQTLYNNGTPEASISHSPVSWWKLNNTTTGIQDSKGSNNGTNNGATEYPGFVNKLVGDSSGMSQANLVQSDLQTVAPYSKYAIKFEAAGGNERIEGIGNTLGNGFSELSISAWVKYSSSPGNQYWPIISKSGSLGSSFDLQNMRSGASSNGGELYFNVRTQNGSFNAFSGVIPSTNVWYNVVGTYNGSEVKIYINNSLKGTLPATGAINTNNSQVYIGDSGHGGYSAMFKGIMSNISVWDTGLTSSQVTEIYNEGLPSNLNNHSAYSNLVSWWQLGENSSFDGSNWLFADEKGSNNGESINMTISDLVNGVDTTANGVSSGMSEGNLVGDAPYSTANAISSNMVITSRVTGSGNTP